ncbi:MAG: T9SS type A sorting domain-containing protein, partial [Chitinophagaceae bacterium]
VNNIQFTLSGTHDANDLTQVRVYYNPTAPTTSGASFLAIVPATFAAPHVYNVNLTQSLIAGSTGYFIISVDAHSSATLGNTVTINGATNPVVLGFTTAPNITNNQTDNGGVHVLPVSFVTLKAFQKSNGIQVEWEVASEFDIAKYQVERSGDGRTFVLVGTINSPGNTTAVRRYNWFDSSPLQQDNFYRVGALGKNGEIKYSPVFRLSIGRSESGISLYPNPVIKHQAINLRFNDMEKGNYKMRLYNGMGQLLINRLVEHAGGSSVETFTMNGIQTGTYLLEISGDNNRFAERIIIE